MNDLTLRHAYLFSHGIGFFLFEKQMTRSDSQSFEFKIKKKDINDVLNSLMVFTSTGQISSIAYSSDVKETIKDKYLQDDDYFNYIVNNLRGQRLKFSLTGQEKILEGNLIGGESYNSSFKKKKNVLEKYVLIYDNGIISQLPFSLVNKITVSDSEVLKDIKKALEINSTLDEEESVLKVFYIANPDQVPGKAIIGYAIPIALWKINYRVKIDSTTSNAFLDSFCILNNPLNEDWIDTEISLITGRPVAFTYNLNRTDKLERTIMDQTDVSAVDPVEQEIRIPEPSYTNNVASSKSQEPELGTKGYKIELEYGRTSLLKQSDLNLLRYDLLSNFVKLVDTSFDEKFESLPMEKIFQTVISEEIDFGKLNLGQEYKFHINGVKTIKAKENAIVPLFSNLKLPCLKLLYINMGFQDSETNPFTSIELINETDYPFENGPCVIFEDNTPVGEAILPTCFTSQNRIISYSKEPRVTIKKLKLESFESKKEFSFIHRPLSVVEKFSKFEIITLKITSNLTKENDKNPNLLILDYLHPENWEVVKDELDSIKVKTLERGYRFSIPIEDKSTIVQPIKFKHEFSNETDIQNISKSYFALFNDKITDNDIKKRFEEHFRLSNDLESLKIKAQKLAEDKQTLEKMIGRIRNNLKAIPDITGNKTRNNFVLKLNKFEEDHDRLEKELQSLTDQRGKILKQLEALR